MTTYNAVVESEVKVSARQLIPGGASTLAENISAAVLTALTTQYGSTDVGYAWPEYKAGFSYPSWVDDAVLHVSSSSAPTSVSQYGEGLWALGTRLQTRQLRTNFNETQVLGTPSAYGVVPPQLRQLNFKSWQN